MNHQVEHNIDVQSTRRKHGEPVRLKEHRPSQLRLHRQHCRVEPLQMPRLQYAALLRRQRKQIIRFSQRCRNRLFHQNIDARIQQRRSHSVMMHRRHGNTRRVHAQVGLQQFVQRRENRNGISFRRLSSASGVGLNRRCQRDRKPRRLKFVINTKMVTPECAGPSDRYSQNGIAGYWLAPLPSTALRHRP